MVFSSRLLHSFVPKRPNVYCFLTVSLKTIPYGSYLGQPRSNVMLLIDSPWVFSYANRPIARAGFTPSGAAPVQKKCAAPNI